MDTRPPTTRSQRCRLIVEVTAALLAHDEELRLCEGLRLIEASAQAITQLAPETAPAVLAHTIPMLRRRLFERFGIMDAIPPH